MSGPVPVEPSGSGPAQTRSYRAFISYSRHDDLPAERLHAFLETYRVPSRLAGRIVAGRPIPARLSPVFRDRDELAGSADLGAAIAQALRASDALIVLCSPAAKASRWVDEEIRLFKAMGRSARIFPMVVAGPEPGTALDEGCFPGTLRIEIGLDGLPTGRPAEPLAADARPGQDGWYPACLKLVAGLLEVPYDDLRRREEIRRRRRLAVRAAAGAGAALAAVAGYVGLADSGLPVPAGETIRLGLDREGVTLFRPVRPRETVIRTVVALRREMRARLIAAIDDGTLLADPELSAWELGQVAGALLNDPALPAEGVAKAIAILAPIFAAPDQANPRFLRLTGNDDEAGPRAEHVFWTVIALSAALGRPDVTDLDLRRRLGRQLSEAQQAADGYNPLDDGGWNVVPRQIVPGAHYAYTTALALHMMLAVRSAGLGWQDDVRRLDTMIANTVDWLSINFVDEPGRQGWRRGLGDDRPPDSGITLLVYAALGRVCSDTSAPPLPETLRTAAVQSQIALAGRDYGSADPDIRIDMPSRDASGRRWPNLTVTRMIWYPWAAEGLTRWRRCGERLRLPAETMRRLDRSVGHLLVDISGDMMRDVMSRQRQLFVVAETYYGLGRAP